MIPIPPQEVNNYYKSIADHKDVTKIVMMLSSAVNSFRADINNSPEQYSDYHFLWEHDRDKVVLVSEKPNLRLSDIT